MPRSTHRAVVAALLLTAFASPSVAAPPLAADERAAVAGQPTSLEVAPVSVTLTGTHDARQLVVSGKYADGSVRDLTAVAGVKAEPAGVVEVLEGAFLRPKKDGAATLIVAAGGKEARVQITVTGMDEHSPVSF